MKHVVLAAGAALVLAGCASSNGAANRSASEHVPPPATTARLSALPPAPVVAAPTDPASRHAARGLVLATDITRANFTLSSAATTPIPQPCAAASTKAILERVRPAVEVGRQFTLTEPDAVLSEDLALMPSSAGVNQVLDAARAGLACVSGRFYLADGTTQTVQIQGPKDISPPAGLPIGTVTAWTLQNNGLTASLAIGHAGRAVVSLIFVAPASAELSALAQSLGPEIVAAAMARLKRSGVAG